MEAARRFLVLFFLLAGVGIVGNIVAETKVLPPASAWFAKPAPELAVIIAHEQTTLHERYGIAAELHDAGRGAALVVPVGVTIDPYQNRYLSRMSLDEEEYDSEIDARLFSALLQHDHIASEGRLTIRGDIVPYVIVTEPHRADDYVLVTHEGTHLFVPGELLDGDR